MQLHFVFQIAHYTIGRSDIIAGPSGLAVISLQKVDSLLILGYVWKLKRFLGRNAGGIRIKIHLNLQTVYRHSLVILL
jgi:hypothetical protein